VRAGANLIGEQKEQGRKRLVRYSSENCGRDTQQETRREELTAVHFGLGDAWATQLPALRLLRVPAAAPPPAAGSAAAAGALPLPFPLALLPALPPSLSAPVRSITSAGGARVQVRANAMPGCVRNCQWLTHQLAAQDAGPGCKWATHSREQHSLPACRCCLPGSCPNAPHNALMHPPDEGRLLVLGPASPAAACL
jgi:hypothetical protein